MSDDVKAVANDRDALPAELIAKIKAIQIRTQRVVTDALSGDYASAFKGRGMEFEQVREYQPGDDIRTIDWNVTARLNAPFVKQFKEERELTVIIMVDVSSSGAFGTHQKSKREIAAEVAAVLAYTAIRSNDRVGLLIFSDEIEEFIPPKKGRAHVWRVIRAILTHHPKKSGTNLRAALEYLGRITRRQSLIFLVSDFLDTQFENQLRTIAKRHEVVALRVCDPRERVLPDIGLATFEDAETGEIVHIDTSSASARKAYAKNNKALAERQREFFRQSGIGEIRIASNEDIVDPIVHYFRSHHGGSRRGSRR